MFSFPTRKNHFTLIFTHFKCDYLPRVSVYLRNNRCCTFFRGISRLRDILLKGYFTDHTNRRRDISPTIHFADNIMCDVVIILKFLAIKIRPSDAKLPSPRSLGYIVYAVSLTNLRYVYSLSCLRVISLVKKSSETWIPNYSLYFRP